MVGGNGPNARRPLSSNEHEAALFGLSEKCGHNLNVRDQSSAGTASDAGGGGMSTRKPSASASSATVLHAAIARNSIGNLREGHGASYFDVVGSLSW
jgi:hypothetical protein